MVLKAERHLILLVDVGDQRSLCVVNDQLVGNPKRKV
jgi:predicted regulator of Ras-like GTPase activity (Roadblock/LC7/MglB family)